MSDLSVAEQALDNRILAEGLHVKHDAQLIAMRDSHDAKRAHAATSRLRVHDYPDSVRWELKKQGGLSDAEIETELAEQQAYWEWKVTRLTEVVELLDAEAALRADDKVSRDPIGTAYFIDSDNGNDTNDGLGIGTAWKTFNEFTENARSAGDVATVRRGMTANYDDGGVLTFTSDGDLDNPIILEADYDDDFGDHVNLAVTATAMLTFGSKIITFASDISSVLAAGDVIYVTAENAREWAYEVAAVSTITVTLYLPYKGTEAGSGKAMTNMQSLPKWNTVAGNFAVELTADNNWLLRGIHWRGVGGGGLVRLRDLRGIVIMDCVIEPNGSANRQAIRALVESMGIWVRKCRMFNYQHGIVSVSELFSVVVSDSLLDGRGITGSAGIAVIGSIEALATDTEFQNHDAGDMDMGAVAFGAFNVRLRNCILDSAVQVARSSQADIGANVFSEDHNGVLGDTRQFPGRAAADDRVVLQSDTGTVRSGGGAISLKITPTTTLGAVQGWSPGAYLLFEYPFYATTDSKTYDVYFRPTATADWTDDPTAGELWIEIEYWGHASNNFRRLVKSTGVIDMNGSTAWAALSLTVAPAQAGVLYLRAWYAKPKEGGKANTFLVDSLPEVT